MRVLLSTIGSRGDVQPLVALASQLRLLGQEVRLCVPPDFRAWIEDLGMPVTSIGPELRSTAQVRPPSAPPTAEQRRQMAEATVAAQFKTLASAAEGCDLIIGATALQIAAPSIAESMGLSYFFVAYCPAVLPSRHHAPPVLWTTKGGTPGADGPPAAANDYGELWDRDAQRFTVFAPPLNAHRASLGLSPIEDVRSHIFTARPWLAADPRLAPWPDESDASVFQPGAWFLPDARPLPEDLTAFLEAGEPPVYFGFGSVRAPENVGPAMVEAARMLGRRAIVSRGWAEISFGDDCGDAIRIGDVDHEILFERVAAVVHHGGAGTTTAAARAGAPQVVIPQHYDQHYWARRVRDLGIGAAHGPESPSRDSLAQALAAVFEPAVAARARSVADAVRSDGATIAARRLIEAGEASRR